MPRQPQGTGLGASRSLVGDQPTRYAVGVTTSRAIHVGPLREHHLLYLGGFVAAVGLGLFTAINPALGLGMFFGLAAIAGFSRSGTFAVCAFTTTIYFERLGDYTGTALSPIKLAGGALIIVALLSLALRNRPGVAAPPRPAWRGHPIVIASIACFVLWALASAAWATNVGQVQSLGMRMTTDVLVFLAVGVFLVRRAQFTALAWTMLLAATASILLGQLFGFNLFERAIGLFTDPNDLAAALSPAAAFGFALVQTARHRWQQALALACMAVCIYGVLITQSRGGLLSLAVVATAIVLTSRGRERLRMVGGVLVIAALGTMFVTLAPQGQGLLQRLTHTDSSGRTDLWRVAIKQYQDHPVRGVGLGNYPVLSRRYLTPDVRHTELFVSLPRTTHNTTLEILAELGTVGFVFFYSFLLGCVGIAWRGVRLARKAADPQLVAIGRGVFVATLSAVSSGIFLSAQYEELLWIMLAAGLGFHACVLRSLRDGSPDPAAGGSVAGVGAGFLAGGASPGVTSGSAFGVSSTGGSGVTSGSALGVASDSGPGITPG